MPLSNMLGVASIVWHTNYTAPTFEPVGCLYCERIHHYRVIEGYQVIRSNLVSVLVDGKLSYLSVTPPETNYIGLWSTNYVEHPSLFIRRSMREMTYPPLPPLAKETFLQARRSNTNIVIPPVK